jgi:hypothetical protein
VTKLYLRALEALQKAQRPLTTGEIAKTLGTPAADVSKALWHLRAMGLSHICDRKPTKVGFCVRQIPLHAAGPGVNVPEPPGLSHREIVRRWRAGRKTRVASVFDLGHKRLPYDSSREG